MGEGYPPAGRLSRQKVLKVPTSPFTAEKVNPKHTDIAGIYVDLGNAYKSMGDYAKGEKSFRGALSRAENTPKNIEGVRVAVGNLAEVCDKQGKHEEAERLYLREIRIMEENSRENGLYKVWIAYPLAYLAEIYRKQGRTEESERLFNRSLAAMNAAKLNNSSVPETMENYAQLLRQVGKTQEAEKLTMEAKARRAGLPKGGF